MTRWHYEPSSFRPLAKQTPIGTLLSVVNDHLGTPRELVEEGGCPAWMAKYTAWGVVREARAPQKRANDNRRAIYRRIGVAGSNLALTSAPGTSAFDCPIAFQGQWADLETGLAYNRNRYFDPSIGQYYSCDPLRLGGGERLHGYVTIPTTGTDPLGLSGTVFNDIKATQPNYPGSEIPRSFEMKLPNGKTVWVHPNATEHLAEDLNSIVVKRNMTPEAARLYQQQQLRSLQSAIDTATKDGIPYNTMTNANGWELQFGAPGQTGSLPAVTHALPAGGY